MGKTVNYEELMKNAVCQILIDEKFCDVAFVIGEHYLLSVGHSFVNFDKKKKKIAKFLDGTTVSIQLIRCIYEHDHLKDYALFRAEKEFKGKKPLPVSFPKNISGQFVSLGSGDILQSFSNAKGEFIGLYYNNNDEFFFKLSSGQAGQAGFSGAPIFSIYNRSVVAIQCEATTTEVGPERDTVLAFPLIRLLDDDIVRECLFERPTVKVSSFIEKNLLPVFGKALLGLEQSDNLEAYMRCIVVKLVPEQGIRFTVFVAKTSNDTLTSVIRQHHKTRKMRYGVVGGMLRANVPIIYDFKHNICYQLGLGGIGIKSKDNILSKKTRGAQEDRIALLVAPIRNKQGDIVGVLSFDFFPVQNPKKDITEIINDNEIELGRILYLSELYAQTLSQLLFSNLKMDVDFDLVLPE